MTPKQTPRHTTEFERVDSIPVELTILMQMGVQTIIDELYNPHGNHQGLSVGWLVVIFLTYILTEADHKMCPVQEWVVKHRHTLERLTGQTIGPTDFTDDRLGDVLRYLSHDTLWRRVEQNLGQRIIRVYDLATTGPVRLDATVGGVNHDEKKHPLFKMGRNKQGGFEVQFKLMLGTLDPLGLPLAGDVVAGSAADDPLYVPIYLRIRETLGQSGLLYIGDCKMGALEIRAVMVNGGDFHLMPLAMVGDIPALLDEQLDKVLTGQVELSPIYLPEDLPTDPQEEPDPALSIAAGFETVRQQEATLEDGTVVRWQERLLVIRSHALADVQAQALERRLDKAEAAILALTPPPGRGKRQFDDPLALQQACDDILSRYKVTDLLKVEVERQVTTRQVRKYRDRPARTEEKVRYVVHLTRRQDVIDQAKQRLGWRLYATNAPTERLSLTLAVLAYRDQYLAERSFARLKGPLLAMLPLYVQRDDHAKGLVHLLTMALRAMVIIEFVVRRSLAEQQETLNGLYDGNPKRRTARPSADLLLAAFQDITLAIRFNSAQEITDTYLTPLSDLQVQILALLGLSPSIYERLTSIPVAWPWSQDEVCPASILADPAREESIGW
jgi:transposase